MPTPPTRWPRTTAAPSATRSTRTKKGPSFQKTAAKYKGKADAEAKLTEFLTKSPKVKMDDGTEEEHKAVKAKDAAQVKNLVQWILAQ